MLFQDRKSAPISRLQRYGALPRRCHNIAFILVKDGVVHPRVLRPLGVVPASPGGEERELPGPGCRRPLKGTQGGRHSYKGSTLGAGHSCKGCTLGAGTRPAQLGCYPLGASPCVLERVGTGIKTTKGLHARLLTCVPHSAYTWLDSFGHRTDRGGEMTGMQEGSQAKESGS